MTIIKNSQGSFRYKMGINCYRLTTNKDYTLCLEILNTDYKSWEKTQVFVDRYTSQGLKIGKTSVNRFSGTYLDANGKKKYMNYHRSIVNFRKKDFYSGNFYLDVFVNIPQEGNDLIIFPRNFTGVYIIAYGIMGTVSNIDPDKVYDYHTAFDIKPTEVVYNVDINANQKAIRNIKLEQNSNNSAATVGMVKELIPFTKKYVYRKYFEDFYYFKDANSYNLNSSSSGIIITGIGDKVVIPNRTIEDVKTYGLI